MNVAEARGLLGLGADYDARELKRAYLRAVKRHPPETNPSGFRRVRAAFEALEGEATVRVVAVRHEAGLAGDAPNVVGAAARTEERLPRELAPDRTARPESERSEAQAAAFGSRSEAAVAAEARAATAWEVDRARLHGFLVADEAATGVIQRAAIWRKAVEAHPGSTLALLTLARISGSPLDRQRAAVALLRALRNGEWWWAEVLFAEFDDIAIMNLDDARRMEATELERPIAIATCLRARYDELDSAAARVASMRIDLELVGITCRALLALYARSPEHAARASAPLPLQVAAEDLERSVAEREPEAWTFLHELEALRVALGPAAARGLAARLVPHAGPMTTPEYEFLLANQSRVIDLAPSLWRGYGGAPERESGGEHSDPTPKLRDHTWFVLTAVFVVLQLLRMLLD